MLWREALHIFPQFQLQNLFFKHLEQTWSLKPKLQEVAACPSLSFPPLPDSFALFPRQLIYITFFSSLAALGITFSDPLSCCVKKLLSESLKGKSPHLTFLLWPLADELVIT